MDNGQHPDEEISRELTSDELVAEVNRKFTCCIIPCKIDSNRLKSKNFREVNGRPMIIWTVLKAMACPHIDMIAISTDDHEKFKEILPEISLSVFDEVVIVQRGEAYLDPTTPIYNLVLEALNTLDGHGLLEIAPTHVVMLQPNVPGIPQEVIDDLVGAVVEGSYNVARHFNSSGAMTGGCDAYKVGALTMVQNMDSYNYGRWTEDVEVHDEAELELVDQAMKKRSVDSDA